MEGERKVEERKEEGKRRDGRSEVRAGMVGGREEKEWK